MDRTEQVLLEYLHAHQGAGLWVLDENLAALAGLQPIEGLEVLSNRFDLFTNLTASNWPSHYSDFDFSPWRERFLDRIYYRVSKEKAVVHHVINQAFQRLKPGGQLVLVGAKNEGAKTYIDKAKALFGEGRVHKEGKGLFSAELIRGNEACAEPLDDRDYDRLRPIGDDQNGVYFSKPGLFGWEKVDQGSAYLLEQLPSVTRRLNTETPRVLDLGCGYGYLSLGCWQQGAGELVATDNNAAAVRLCKENFDRAGVKGEVVADDCGKGIEGRFDLVICNPPFHQGFSVEAELTERFLAAASRLLSSKGQAAFVINRFIPLERKAMPFFSEIETFADNGSFKLVRLARTKR